MLTLLMLMPLMPMPLMLMPLMPMRPISTPTLPFTLPQMMRMRLYMMRHWLHLSLMPLAYLTVIY
jgi:hypothetical protein